LRRVLNMLMDITRSTLTGGAEMLLRAGFIDTWLKQSEPLNSVSHPTATIARNCLATCYLPITCLRISVQREKMDEVDAEF
jgi:hypothetical protein